MNSLVNNNLSIGQALILKENKNEYPQAETYKVKKGDTLYSIALNNNITVDDLKKVNGLKNNNLEINQILVIPDSKMTNDEIIDDYEVYTVKKGDSLWKISKEFNITIPELINLNNLTNLTLQIGDQLLVPKEKENLDETYIVQPGDTLWSVAKNNNITVQELKELNNLDNSLLSIGQKLKIK